MDQFITLLSNLFSLTKVASVTLPGLTLGAVVLYLFWPPAPVDTVAIANPNSKSVNLSMPAAPCSHLPSALRKDNEGCKLSVFVGPLENDPRQPACTTHLLNLSQFDRPPDDRTFNEAIDLFVKTEFFVEKENGNLPPGAYQQTRDKIEILARGNKDNPWDSRVLKQFVLEKASDRLTQCDEIERAWKGQEETDNLQLTADIANLDKQRADLQDAYISSLKANNFTLTENFRRKLEAILNLTNEWRERYRLNLVSINERAHRSDEIKREQDIIGFRLSEPGRLRPIKTFDLYSQGLLNHVVALILLSLAVSLILNALDRAVFGTLFELLMRGW